MFREKWGVQSNPVVPSLWSVGPQEDWVKPEAQGFSSKQLGPACPKALCHAAVLSAALRQAQFTRSKLSSSCPSPSAGIGTHLLPSPSWRVGWWPVVQLGGKYLVCCFKRVRSTGLAYMPSPNKDALKKC